MKTLSIRSTLLLFILFPIAAPAQTETARRDKSYGATVTASASGERVRFAAPSSVVQIRLEVYNSTGKKVFDNEVRGENVRDWHLQDGQAEPLADDAYLCVVTVKSLSGKLGQRIGSVTIGDSSASVQPLDASQLTAQQSQAIGPVEQNASLIVLNDDDHQTTTVIAHNGEEGQIVRGRGSLTFRIGDFFSGKDTEQMRLTPEGNLGVGITHPQARLDVDGLIRARQGIVFPDGSIQYSAATRTYGAKSTLPGALLQNIKSRKNASGGQEHIEAVASTTNTIPKWTDSLGTLGDTVAPIYETAAGNVGIGTTTPDPFKLNVNRALNVGGSNLYLGGKLRFTENAAAGYTNFLALNGNLTNFDGVNYEQLNLYNPGGDKALHLAQTANGSQINSIGTGNTSLLLQPSGGNVGIGTTLPSALWKLTVQSDVGPGVFASGKSNVITSGSGFEAVDAFGGAGNGFHGGDGVKTYGGTGLGAGSVGGNGVTATGGDGSTDGSIAGDGIFASPGGVFNGAAAGRAGAFLGHVQINGTLTVTSTKNFKIDHPLDPENKYLLHAAIESSEVLNIYSGNVVTDSQAEAVVTLPDWFEAVNTDLRYQLTVIGAFSQAIVASEVRDHHFTIKTSAPRVKVSWQVTGVRSDAVMLKHPFQVEEEKPERERGSYLSPEAFGQPEEKGVEWARYPELMRQMKERREKAQQKPQREQ